MTYVTEILADESGIQYQGVKDKTGSTGTYPITGLITGKFRRGRFDKPMTITNANIRAMLGYDPKNPCYVAVQDVLSQGVPSVQVLRLQKERPLFCYNITSGNTVFQIRPMFNVASMDEFITGMERSIKVYVGQENSNEPIPVSVGNYSLESYGSYLELHISRNVIGSYFWVAVCSTQNIILTTLN